MFLSRLEQHTDEQQERHWYWRWVRLRHMLSKPYFLLAITFALAIAVGAHLLMLPWCMAEKVPPLSYTDAYFTSTSAICVTGLTTRDTGHDFSFFGQLVILFLIQLGGIGIMTLSTMVFLGLRKKATLYDQGYLREFYGADASSNLPRVVGRISAYILWCEGVGAGLLFVRFATDKTDNGPWLDHILQSLWSAVFHSISAFCNAGFGLYNDSLVRYAGDWTVNLVVMGLIVLGGLGFFVMADLHQAASLWRRHRPAKLRYQSKLVLAISLFLITFGATVFWGLERNNPGTLTGAAWDRAGLVSLFQSVTCRTAGFNTLDLRMLTPATLLLMMALMFIGGAPGGTAGGIKVTTFGVLMTQMMYVIRPRREPAMMGRAFSKICVRNAVALTVCAFSLMIVGVWLVLAFQSGRSPHADDGLFLRVLFEVISAQGTVGLSLDFTTELVDGSKWVIAVLMFLGRIGPLGMFSAALEHSDYEVEYPAETVNIG